MKSKTLIMSVFLIGMLAAVGSLAYGAPTTPIYDGHESGYSYDVLAGKTMVAPVAVVFSLAFMSTPPTITPVATRGAMIAEPAVILCNNRRTVFHKARDSVS